jgi:hypothetical protein
LTIRTEKKGGFMIKRTLFRGIMERLLNGLMWTMLILSFSLFISTQKAQAETCSTTDYEMAIAAGAYHTVGLHEDGTVVAVGNNDNYGQLDVAVPGSPWTNIKAVAAGGYQTAGLKKDGTVVTNGSLQLDVNKASWTTIKSVAVGWDQLTPFMVGLKEDGTVVAAGSNLYDRNNVYNWTKIKSIAAGLNHTVGLQEDGTIVVAGSNGSGQTIPLSPWTNIKAVAAGWNHTVGLKENGTVVAMGSNRYGQLNVDVPGSEWTNIIAIAAGANHTVGLKADGTVVAVGDYGLGVSSWGKTLKIKAIAAGVYHTVGLQEDGTVVATGSNGLWLNTTGWSNIKPPTCLIAQIIDNIPPELNVSVSPSMLWPPNHQMVTVTPVISVKDNIDSSPKVKLLSVTSNELDNGLGDGDTANDIVINSNGTISLRAERSGKGSGRIYTITYQATDASGNAATATATVAVPHNK